MSKNKYKRRAEKPEDTAPVAENTDENITETAVEPAEAEGPETPAVPETEPTEEAPAADEAAEEVKEIKEAEKAEAPEADESEEPAAEEAAEETAEETEAEEQEYTAAEGTDASLLSEFAPKPINIPNVDLEKEKRRQERRSKNRSKERKKVEARKNKSKKKRISTGQKVAMGFASFILFLVMTVTMTGFIAAFSVRVTTSSYAIHMAVNNMDTAEIPISRNSNGVTYLPDYEALGVKASSGRAALVDMIRDNSSETAVVTYAEILSGIRNSGMNDLIEKNLRAAADHLLLDKPYSPMTGTDIANVIRNSSSTIRSFTGRELNDTDYARIESYFDGDKMADLSQASLDSTKLRRYTGYTKHLLSLQILAAIMLINIMLIVLLMVLGHHNGSGHIPVGWSFIISGLAVIAGAILLRPSYTVTAPFLQTVINNYFGFFTTAVVVIAGIFTVIGALIFLVGNAASDRDED